MSSSSSSCKNGRSTASCISRILRRILCFNTLPMCSFDRFKEEEKVVLDESGGTPGLVARLMGLESLPLIGPTEESPTTSSSSRSSTQVRRRRIIPAYQELEDESFFILSFERRKCKKQSKRRREFLQGKDRENEEMNIVSEGNLEFVIKGDFRAENPGNLLLPSCRKPEKAVDELENSSPNSVLEFAGFTIDQESDSPEEISRLGNSKMRRPLSEELESCGNSRERKLIDNGDEGQEKIGSRLINRGQNHAEKWDEMGELAAMETMKSSWLRDEMEMNRHCFMEIGRDLESDILDHLLEELLINVTRAM